MNIDKNGLLSALKKAMPGSASGSSIIDGADTFLITGDFVHTYNDSVSVSAPCKLDGLVGTVKCNDLIKPLARLNTPIIQITPSEKKWELVAGRIKATINLLESTTGEYLASLKLGELAWKSLPANFTDGVRMTRIPNNRSPYRGICVNGTTMISTDQVQMNRFELAEAMDTFWLDETAVEDYLKFTPGAVAYAVSESWVHLKMADGAIFSARRKEHADYPFAPLDGIIEARAKKEGDLTNHLPLDIGEVASRVATLATDQKGTLPIRLTLTTTDLEVYAERLTGNIAELIPWETPFTTDPKLQLWIASDFLIEAASRKALDFHISVDEDSIPWVVFTGPSFVQVAGVITLD